MYQFFVLNMQGERINLFTSRHGFDLFDLLERAMQDARNLGVKAREAGYVRI